MDEGNPRLARAGRWAALVGIAALVIAVGFGVIGATLGPPLPAATVAAVTPGPPSLKPSQPRFRVLVDSLNQKLTVESYLTGQMPGKPFIWEASSSVVGLFDEVISGGVVSDPGYVKGTVPATIFVGIMESAAVIEGDLPGTARGVTDEMARRGWSGLVGLQVNDLRTDAPSTIGTMPAQWGRAMVTGTRSDGGAEKADLGVLLVELPNDRHFVMVTVKPDRPSAAAYLPAIDAAVASLRPAN